MRRTLTHNTLIGLQIIVGLILTALFLSLYKYTETLLIQHCDEKATRDLERIELTIHRELSKVESVAFMFSEIKYKHGLNIPRDEETIYRQLEEIVHASPQPITGAILGFEDSVFPQYASRNGFLPLVRKTDEGLIRFQVGEIRDVRRINDWYYETKRRNRPRWSKPQLSEEGTEISCYCIPLHDAEGKFIGVLALDCSLETLGDQIRAIRSYPNSEPLIIDDDFNIVVSLDRQDILHETMFSLLKKRGLAIDEELKEEIRSHHSGKKHIIQGDFKAPHELYFYHQYENHSGWTIQMTCPAKEITEGLRIFRERMAITALVTFVLILLVALTYMRRSSNKQSQ